MIGRVCAAPSAAGDGRRLRRGYLRCDLGVKSATGGG